MKKAGAEMWWIIIGAVIALVVLIILMVMFTGKTSLLEQGLISCDSKGGRCESCQPAISRFGGNDCSAVCDNLQGGDYSYSSVFSCNPKESTGCCIGTKDI